MRKFPAADDESGDAIAEGGGAINATDFYLKRVVAGDIEGVRARLADALESLGYAVIDSDPIRARRGARGWGGYYCSADILDYPTRLTVALKPLTEAATLVTFDYEVRHTLGMATKWDKQTLLREAEAIIALAGAGEGPTRCAVCETSNVGDSRFCRHCGAQYGGRVPAELEVLRLTSGGRAGYHFTGMGLFGTLVTLLVVIPLLMSGTPKAANLGAFLLLFGGSTSFIITLIGALQLRQTLNTSEARPAPAVDGRHAPPLFHPAAHTPALAWRSSVTEGPTDLLDRGRTAPEESPLERKVRRADSTGRTFN
jgi:hypothetical protein